MPKTLLTRMAVVLVALLFSLLPSLVILRAQSAPLPTAARTLGRNGDAVIVTGQQMPLFSGAPLAQLFVYIYSGGTWRSQG